MVRRSANGPFALPVLALAVLFGMLAAPGLAPPVSSQPLSAQTFTTAEIIEQLDATGSYSDFNRDADIDDAVAGVNAEGVAFAWIDTESGGEQLAQSLLQGLDERNSRYRTVLVLTNSGVWAESSQVDPGPAASAAIEDFSRGAVATGLDTFADTLAGRSGATEATSNDDSSENSSSGGGLPAWLWLLVLAGLGFLGFRFWSGKRKTKQEEAELLEIDRLEIKEQLKDNADRVIELGDKVIASNDQDLIRTYELASKAYTNVSTEIDAVTTIVEMNRLDDRIDHAEWQFEVIEAKLEGRTPPTLPGPESDDARPSPTTPATAESAESTEPRERPTGSRNDRPALSPDDSVFGSGSRRRSSRTGRARRSRSGGLGGGRGMGGGGLGGLGGILGSIILGGGLGRPRTTRRTQRRRASTGSHRGGFDIGGDVFRRTGAGSRTTRSGGGSLGRRASRGGGGRF